MCPPVHPPPDPQSLKFIAPAATLTLLAGSAVREYPGMVANNAGAIVAR